MSALFGLINLVDVEDSAAFFKSIFLCLLDGGH